MSRHGFGSAVYFGAYDATVEAGVTDQLVVIAQLSGMPAYIGSRRRPMNVSLSRRG